jgi:hypothetical protein
MKQVGSSSRISIERDRRSHAIRPSTGLVRRGRRRVVVGLAAVVIVTAAIVVPLEVAGPSYYSVPSSIPSNCSTDVTVALSRWLNSLPQGRPGNETRVSFAGGCYLVDGQIYLRGFQDFLFDGNGATFRQSTPVPAETTDSDLPDRPAYCGYSGWQNPRYTEILKVDIMWLVEGGCDLTFENMTIAGADDGAPGGAREQDSFMAFDGSQRVLVSDVTMSGPYGDYVDAQGLHEAPDGGGAYPATDVTVRDCHLSGSGREGFGIILAKRVTIIDNTILSAADADFDIEFDSLRPAGLQTDILIAGNTIVGQHYAFLVGAFTSAKIERLRFTGNDLIDGAQMRIWVDPGIESEDIRVDHNMSSEPPPWPHRASVTIYDASSSSVDHNTSPVAFYAPEVAASNPFATGGPGVQVDHNTLTGVPIAEVTQGGVAVAQGGAMACSNESKTGALYDSPCKSVAAVASPVVASLPL